MKRTKKNGEKKEEGFMDKIKKGYKKWFVINIGHYLEKSIIKTEKSMTEIDIKIC